MPQELIHVTTRRRTVRVLMILFLIAAGGWCYFVLNWYLGNMFAENLNAGARDMEIALMAKSLAPNDPLVHWRLAVVSQSKLPFNQIGEAITEYEKAVSLSPNDYRFWTALGVAYEQAGEHDKGERALKRAVELAPSYAQPHWFLGNLLLRRARYDEAFSELRLASDAKREFRPQLFTFLWEIYGSDFDSLSKALGSDAATRAEFSLQLLKQKRFKEGLRLWSSLSPAEKAANKSTADAIVTTLLSAQRYYDTMNVWNEIAPNSQTRAAIGELLDGGFEESINYRPEMAFAWQVKNAPQMQIGIDPSHAHSGNRSLRLIFQVRARLTALDASQLVLVVPDTEYQLEFYRQSLKLESGATPAIQVSNLTNGAVLAASDGAANGDSDWERVSLSFKTPPQTEAVRISIVRGACPDTDICPIFGTVWYDDFSLKRN